MKEHRHPEADRICSIEGICNGSFKSPILLHGEPEYEVQEILHRQKSTPHRVLEEQAAIEDKYWRFRVDGVRCRAVTEILDDFGILLTRKILYICIHMFISVRRAYIFTDMYIYAYAYLHLNK